MESTIFKEVIENIPHTPPFLFVDNIVSLDENHIEGNYTLKENEFFYKGHFPEKAITPGVILIEIACQIGVMCIGLYIEIMKVKPQRYSSNELVTFSACKFEFYKPVYPKEKITVKSKKIYYRFKKIKCEIELFNSKNELISKGTAEGFSHKESIKNL